MHPANHALYTSPLNALSGNRNYINHRLARAKTGTGKTLAFLLPAIQRHLLEPNPQHGNPSILVLSPTRELAMQIEKEAQKVIGNATWKSQIVVGGTNINSEVRRLQGRCDILVAVSFPYPEL
jgi:ATP-dependent RNA helicase MSS116, mitochondrial